MNKRYITIILWSAFILLNTIILKNIIIKKNTLNNYFRLHVVANSNSLKDQSIKMNVASDVSETINKLIENTKASTKSDAKEVIQNNVKDILVAANFSLEKQGDSKTAFVKIGNIYYDEKTKDTIHMDAGIYDSIQVIIGAGKGKNFWSLIYPYSYAGMYELNTDDILDNNFIPKDADGNIILTTNDIISNEDVQYKSGIIELAKKMWFK